MLAVGLAVTAPAIEMAGPGEAVEDLHLGGGDRQLAVLVLSIEGEQTRGEQLEVGGRRGPPGDERSRPAGGRHPAPEHDLLASLRQPRGDLAELLVVEDRLRQVEYAFHPRLLGARADDLRPRPTPVSRSSECASTVLPAPVSPVITFRPSPKRSSARSIRRRFSIRNSRSTGSCLAAAGDQLRPAGQYRLIARWPNFSRMRWSRARPRAAAPRRAPNARPEAGLQQRCRAPAPPAARRRWRCRPLAAGHVAADVLLSLQDVVERRQRPRGQRVRRDVADHVTLQPPGKDRAILTHTHTSYRSTKVVAATSPSQRRLPTLPRRQSCSCDPRPGARGWAAGR